ncbi:polyisoprenoid-binding protein [Xylella taiwanensis]|nr:YceI family protein [Xylella taiwanensis]MCD8456154.1 YceI family protein [Xylella taiwanensis]MCD8458561.1 YceI family protein [Xylella taiwanensis]MCD8460696.1 YceI family protein [Xylella taiwanensis]MCD8463242.1 YceI family protein [Xylella taiwanensis]MCD8465201.1 YceI family protein [Xylella taiwanensis]
MLRCTFPLLALLLAVPLASTAATTRYVLDPVHTRIVFAIDHAGISKALGTVSGSTGTLDFDPDNWSSAHLDVRIPLQRVDLGDAKWNKATLAQGLLDATRYPEAHFVSSQVTSTTPSKGQVVGQLTLHGITHEVVLDITFYGIKRHPLPPFRRTAGFSANTTLSRAAFGISAWKSMIGDEVQLRIEVEAVREGIISKEATDQAVHKATTTSSNAKGSDATPHETNTGEETDTTP